MHNPSLIGEKISTAFSYDIPRGKSTCFIDYEIWQHRDDAGTKKELYHSMNYIRLVIYN
jgi:hypothetical protein